MSPETDPAAQPPSPDGTAAAAPDGPVYRIAVRELCAFAAKTGDLDLRFTPAPSAQEGQAGHQAAAAASAARASGYQAERALSGRYSAEGQTLEVRGRADGWDPQARRVDEVKTFKGDLALQPANHRALHWAQAKVYGWLLCQEEGLEALDVALVYWAIAPGGAAPASPRDRETRLTQRFSAGALQAHFNALCQRFLAWARQEAAHRSARNQALAALPFVHAQMRAGQRQLAENVFRAARSGRCLMAQAPTGIGKTLGTVFPLLKAMAAPDVALDKLFYLSAKGPGRALALQALATVRAQAPSAPLRVLELVSRQSACLHPDRACHGESCPLARGFYDRLPAARAQAVALAAQAGAPLLGVAELRAVTQDQAVCPYYLAQELVRWADVVVGDYNYLYDSSALLNGLLQANGQGGAQAPGWRVAVLVDEAHNLLERARAMYSAQLDQARVRERRRAAPPALKAPFNRLNRAWQALNRESETTVDGDTDPSNGSTGAADVGNAYRVLPEIPVAWLQALQHLTQALGDHLSAAPQPGQPQPPPDAALMDFYFDALNFTRLAEAFGPHALCDLQRLPPRAGRGTVLAIRNIVPAPHLAPRLALARSTVLFSATLSPPAFYADLLGLPASTAWLDVAGPFHAGQLAVHLVPQIRTRWQHRAQSCAPLADLMARQFEAEPGNYLAFFSSFDYLAQVAATLAERHPGLPHWSQARGMDDAQRQGFIDRFTPQGQGIGFAVLGGAFGEGIDLPGRRLIGAFIATLGLPQFNPVNAQMRRQLEALFPGRGDDYAFLYPGLRKVVQAAGRVIRTTEDQGCVYLIDDRWRDPRLQALLPGWWRWPGRRLGVDTQPVLA